jgi:hypothetical protein
MSAVRTFLLVLALPIGLGAQERAPVGATRADSGIVRRPLADGFVSRQVLVGIGGLSLGAIAGGMIAAELTNDDGGYEDLGHVLLGMLGGGIVGSSWAVHYYSNRAGHRSRYVATLAGSLLGAAGGPFFMVTVPLGSALGYNAARR